MNEKAGWLTLAYRSGLSDFDKQDRAERGEIPDHAEDRDVAAVLALEELGVRLISLNEDEFPERLRFEGGPVLAQVVGCVDLIDTDEVKFLGGTGAKGRQAIADALEAGDRIVIVLSKGMLKARSMLNALREPIEDGSVTLLSVEPPQSTWGPIRDANRDQLMVALQR